MKQTFKVILLPTDKSNIWLRNGKLEYNSSASSKINPHHLYIISNDEPKAGDWVLHHHLDKVVQVVEKNSTGAIRVSDGNIYFDIANIKIVASTESAIIADTGKWIPESFVQAYVKAYNSGTPITEVDLEMTLNGSFDIAVKEGKQELEYLIKTRPDNSVIVHQSKLYTRDEVSEHLYNCLGYFAHQAGINFDGRDVTKWIKDNL